MINYKVDFDIIEWESPMEGIRHKIYSFQKKKLRLVEYNKKMPPHWCEKGHIGYVLQGEMEIKFSEHTFLFEFNFLLKMFNNIRIKITIPFTMKYKNQLLM